MRCPRCDADISPLRDHCPRCGAATDPASRDRGLRPGGERSPDELKRNRKVVLAVVAGVLVLSAAMGRIHPFGHHLSVFPGGFHIDTSSSERGPVTVGAQQLYQAYRDNPEAAERQFGRRELVVTGEFLRTVPDGYGSIDMRLNTSNPDAPLGVDLDGASVAQATRLEAGESVTVSCRRVARTGDEHWLQDCLIQPPAAAPNTSGPAPPAPPGPSAPPRPSPPR